MQSLIFQLGRAKIDQQPNVDAGGFQVVDHLRRVKPGQVAGSLDFQDDGIFNQEVGEKIANALAAEVNLQGYSRCIKGLPYICRRIRMGRPLGVFQEISTG